MPVLAFSDENETTTIGSEPSRLFTLCERVFAEAVRLGTRLASDQEIHVAEISGRINLLFRDLDAQAAEDEATQQGWQELRPLLRDLIDNVLSNSAWLCNLACTQCLHELRVTLLPPGAFEETARDWHGGDRTMLILFALRAREPHDVYDGRWTSFANQLLEQSNPRFSSEAFAQTAPAPEMPEPLVKPSVLHIPHEARPEPVGLAGDAWLTVQTFYEENKIKTGSLPWFLLLGETASGKTAFISAPDQPFAVAGDDRTRGTHDNFTWWYATGHGMVLEVPGRFTAESATDSEAAQWSHMLELLAVRSPRPIDGVVLAVDLVRVLSGETEAEALAARLRSLLQVTARSLHISFPVYLVFTHSETLFGFSEFARRLEPEQQAASLGWVPDNDLTQSFDGLAARDGISAIARRLDDLLPHVIIRAEDQVEATHIYALPGELENIRESIGYFTDRLFIAFGTTPLYFFRGFWFVAAQPSGTPIQRAYAYTPPSEKAPEPLPESWADQPLFSAELFTQRFFKEKNLVLSGPVTPEENTVASRWSRFKLYSAEKFASLLGPFQIPLTTYIRLIAVVLFLALLWFLGKNSYQLFRAIEVTRVFQKEPPLHMDFMLLPGGTYIMGSTTSDRNRLPNEMPHEVTLSKPFYLGIYEVTQAQWLAIMKSRPTTTIDVSLPPNLGLDFPVANVSWEDSQRFLEILNEKTRDDGRYRLPTEAEWEYAARTGASATLPEDIGAHAWYAVNSDQRTHPVGLKRPNEWGIYDMIGNVSEWVEDYYGPYGDLPVTDPLGPAEGDERVRRGGAFFDRSRSLRTTRRMPITPDYAKRWMGLRLVWVPAPDSPDGRYLAEHAGRVKAFYIARQWLRENGASISVFFGDMGDSISSLWADEQKKQPEEIPVDAPTAKDQPEEPPAKAEEPAPEAAKEETAKEETAKEEPAKEEPAKDAPAKEEKKEDAKADGPSSAVPNPNPSTPIE